MLEFTFKEQDVKLSKFNPRTEFHGEAHQLAGDLKIVAKLPNACLLKFAPTLKDALYYLDKSKLDAGGDLADQAQAGDKNFTPHLRLPSLKMPVKWTEKMESAKLTIHYGIDAKSDLVLADCKVGDWEIDAQDGGTVELTFTAQSKVDDQQAGRLCAMQQSDIRISLEPAPKPQLDAGGGTE